MLGRRKLPEPQCHHDTDGEHSTWVSLPEGYRFCRVCQEAQRFETTGEYGPSTRAQLQGLRDRMRESGYDL